MLYKYQARIDLLRLTTIECPCVVAEPRQTLAYRLVRLPANGLNNFVPRPLEPGVPSRNISIPSDNTFESIRRVELENLNEWGISLFEDIDAARRLAKKYRRAFEQHTHVARVQIECFDGVCTPTDFNNHYNLHEAYNADLASQVQGAFPR